MGDEKDDGDPIFSTDERHKLEDADVVLFEERSIKGITFTVDNKESIPIMPDQGGPNITDFAFWDRPTQLHFVQIALSLFKDKNGRFPVPKNLCEAKRQFARTVYPVLDGWTNWDKIEI